MAFSNWVTPDKKSLELEYKVEYLKKPLKRQLGDPWPEFEDFYEAVQSGEVKKISESEDRKISNRSRTKSRDDLISLIKGYGSYPKYRNEDTVDAIYEGFKNNKKMKRPLVLRLESGKLRIFSGNTRADIAIQLGIEPEVIIVDVE